jgi:hypothetical protein
MLVDYIQFYLSQQLPISTFLQSNPEKKINQVCPLRDQKA